MNQQSDLNERGWRQEISAWCIQAMALAAFSLAFLALAALLAPSFIAFWERASGRLVGYEAGMRFCLALGAGSALGAARALRWRRWGSRQRRLWNAMALTLGLLLPILALDWNSLLQEEYSWIRYPTAMALGGAGLGCLLYASRNRRDNAKAAAIWLLLACGFCFAGLDEILQVHERLGKLMQGTPYPSLASDLITVGYFAACLPVVWLLWRILKTSTASRNGKHGAAHFDLGRLTRGYLAAGMVFGIAQLLDTVDKQIMLIVQGSADWLLRAGFQLPGFWFLLEQPRQLCNSVEEILECAAAVLFLLFTWEPTWEESRDKASQARGTERLPLFTDNRQPTTDN